MSSTVIVPNYAQIDRIVADIEKLYKGELRHRPMRIWEGNSYSGLVHYDPKLGAIYTLYHWNTVICELNETDGLVYFDAIYHSSTTRRYQSRIQRALHETALDSISHLRLKMIDAELNKPTGKRTALDWF